MKLPIKVLIILSYLLTIFVSIAIWSHPITGYELSIYSAIMAPLFVIVFTIIISIVIVILSIMDRCKYGEFLGLLNICLCSLLVILLPIIRGYAYTDFSDNATHIGYIVDIFNMGYIPNNIVYPAIHLLGCSLILLSNLPVNIMAYFVPPLYYIMHISSIFLLCRLVSSRNTAIIASICSMIPLCFYYSELMAMGVGFMTLPLFLFCLIKMYQDPSLKWSVLSLTCLILLIFLHPLAYLMSQVIVFLFIVIILIFNYLLNNKAGIISPNPSIYKNFIYFASISLIIFSLWAFQNVIFNGVIDSINQITQESSLVIAPTNQAVSAFAKLGLNKLDIFLLFIKIYGPLTILGLFSIVGVVIYIVKWHNLHGNIKHILQDKRIISLMFIYIVFFLFCIMAAMDIVKPLTGLASQRFLFSVYSLIPVPSAIGLSLLLPQIQTDFSKKKLDVFSRFDQRSILKYSFLLLVLMVCFTIGIFTIFQSPITYRQNPAISVKDISGAEWLMSNGDKDYSILHDDKSVNPPIRYSNAIFGVDAYYKHIIGEPFFNADEFAHFKYYKFSKLGSSIDTNKYLMIRPEVNLLIYEKLYPLLSRYNAKDFLRLSSDNSVNLIFSNEEMKIYFISPM